VDHLSYWAEEIMTRTPARLEGSHRLTGEYGPTTGPRQQYAKVEFLVEPTEEFEVFTAIEGIEEDGFWENNHPDWAVLGLLDVVLVAWPKPLRSVKITVTDASYHPLWSSRMAFRMAGREAGRKLVELEEKKWSARKAEPGS
jgi:translation elongation factor EF-G